MFVKENIFVRNLVLFDKLDKSINVYELDNNKLLVIFTEQNKISNN